MFIWLKLDKPATYLNFTIHSIEINIFLFILSHSIFHSILF
jgi:hypothetical protein